MALETGTYISDLVATNPPGTDPKAQGDDHLRLIKSTVKATFPAITGAVTPTHTELNYMVGVTSLVQTQLNTKGAKAGQVWTGDHDYTGATIEVPTASGGDADTTAASTAFVDTWFAKKASPTFTGTPAAPTAAPGTNTTQVATTAYVVQQAFSTALPVQTVPAVLYTNGTTASWRTTFVGDSGSGGQLGPVPAPAAGDAVKFLKGDGTWAIAPFAPDVIVQNQVSSGVTGAALTNGSWTSRALNTVIRNSLSIGSLASNQVTLGAGTYLVRGKGTFGAPTGGGAAVNGRLRIYNVTDSSAAGQGEPFSALDGNPNTSGEVVAVVTIASSKAFALQYYVATNGGTEGQPVSTGSVEVYSTLEITRVA